MSTRQTVFRIEDETGIGPWISVRGFKNTRTEYCADDVVGWSWEILDVVFTVTTTSHPRPDSKGLFLLTGSGFRCAVTHPSHLKLWFDEKTLDALHRDGFRIVAYDVEDETSFHDCETSTPQVVFNPWTSVRVLEISIEDLDSWC